MKLHTVGLTNSVISEHSWLHWLFSILNWGDISWHQSIEIHILKHTSNFVLCFTMQWSRFLMLHLQQALQNGTMKTSRQIAQSFFPNRSDVCNFYWGQCSEKCQHTKPLSESVCAGSRKPSKGLLPSDSSTKTDPMPACKCFNHLWSPLYFNFSVSVQRQNKLRTNRTLAE